MYFHNMPIAVTSRQRLTVTCRNEEEQELQKKVLHMKLKTIICIDWMIFLMLAFCGRPERDAGVTMNCSYSKKDLVAEVFTNILFGLAQSTISIQ